MFADLKKITHSPLKKVESTTYPYSLIRTLLYSSNYTLKIFQLKKKTSFFFLKNNIKIKLSFFKAWRLIKYFFLSHFWLHDSSSSGDTTVTKKKKDFRNLQPDQGPINVSPIFLLTTLHTRFKKRVFTQHVFMSTLVHFFSSKLLSPSRRGYSLSIFSKLMLDWKFLINCNLERLLYRLFFYYRLSFYNNPFWKSGVRKSVAKLLLPYLSLRHFFFFFKKSLEDRKERKFFDRLFFEFSEMLFFFDSSYSLKNQRYLKEAVNSRMGLHFFKKSAFKKKLFYRK